MNSTGLHEEVDAVMIRLARLEAAGRTLRSVLLDNGGGAPRVETAMALDALERDRVALGDDIARARAIVHP